MKSSQYDYRMRNQAGAIGLLSVVLLTTLVLIFTLTISLQVFLNVKNAKLAADFNANYYVTEGALRDARFQLKLEDVLTKSYADITMNNVTVTRIAQISITNIETRATGTAAQIQRIFASTCDYLMTNCSRTELLP